MKYFEYMAKDPANGKKMRGIVTGDDQIAVTDSLKSRGVIVMEISPMADVLGIRKILYSLSARIKKTDIKDFFSQLSFMLSANLQLYNALITLRDYSVNKKQRTIARPIAEETRKGASLHEAMNESGLFEYAAVQQVKSGEESGDVPNALKRIEHQYERELEFIGKIKNALVYPILVTIVMVVVLWVLLTMVVPSLASTLANLGGELPMLTQIVIGISNFASKSTPCFFLFAVLGVIAFNVLIKQPDFKYSIDSLKLKIPIIGGMIIKIETSKELDDLAANMDRELPLNSARMFSGFLTFIREEGRLSNGWLYQFDSRAEREVNGAYTVDAFLKMAYIIFNKEAWQKEKLLEKALNSERDANLCLYNSLIIHIATEVHRQAGT